VRSAVRQDTLGERIASVLVKGWKDELDGWQKSSCDIKVENFVELTPCVGDHIKRERALIREEADGDGGMYGAMRRNLMTRFQQAA
jgi:hypothetical protein